MSEKIYIGGAQNPTIRSVREAVEAVIEAEDLIFVGAELGREGSRAILWIYIDKEGGVSIDDCARVSPEVSAHWMLTTRLRNATKCAYHSAWIDR